MANEIKHDDLEYIVFSGIDVEWAREHNEPFPVDAMRVKANLEGLTLSQYFMNEKIKKMHGIGWLSVPYQLSRWKCLLWPFLSNSILGVRDKQVFEGWKIRHCLNCNADPYDSEVLAWDNNDNWNHGAMIRCKQCGQLRWCSKASYCNF